MAARGPTAGSCSRPGSARPRPLCVGISVADDDLALGAAGVDVVQGRHGVGEVEDAIDDGPEDAGVDEGGDLA